MRRRKDQLKRKAGRAIIISSTWKEVSGRRGSVFSTLKRSIAFWKFLFELRPVPCLSTSIRGMVFSARFCVSIAMQMPSERLCTLPSLITANPWDYATVTPTSIEGN